MALVTNNISGSSADSWKIGITGSVIFANPGAGTFPGLPGADTAFFVSGSRGGKGTSGVAVFGGDAVVSGSLTIGTGSITITSNEIQFQGGVARITSGANGLTLFDSAYPSGKSLTDLVTGGGGGGGSNFFLDTAGAGKIYTTASSVAFPFGQSGVDEAADIGSDIVFYVSGAVGVNQKVALFGGNIVSSGSLSLTSGGGEIAHIAGSGEISGSGDLKAGGNLTVGGTTITATTPTSINLGDTAATVNVGQSGTSNTLNVRGNANITGNAVISGDLTVNGTTTTVSTTNLLVEDPLLYIGSGSATVVAYGGLALASGSATADNAMVFVKDSNDVWAVGRQDVTAGTRTNTTTLSYIPLRASSLQLGGTVGSAATTANVYLTSSDGSSAALNVNSGNTLAFMQGGTNKLLFGDYAGSGEALIQGQNGAGVTSALWISGTNVNIGHTTNSAIQLFGNNEVGGRLSIDGTLPNLVFNIAARNATSPFAMSLTGSGVTLGSNAGTTFFQFANTNYAEAAIDTANSSGFKVGAVGGKSMLISGSAVIANAGAGGFRVQRDGAYVGSIQGVVGSSLTLTAYTGAFGPSAGTATQLVLTGSELTLGSQTAGVVNFQQAGGTHLSILKNASTTLITGSASQNVTLAAGAGSTTVEVSGSVAKITGGTSIDFFRDATRIAFVGASPTNSLLGLHPNSDVTYNLGSPERRWANIYTGDLHLRNDRGDWTIIEERDYLSITNNYNGKRYKFVLEEI